MKKGYFYLFYRFYKMSEAAPSRWWSEWKASFAMDGLIVFIVLSVINYYTFITENFIDFGNRKPIAVFVILFIVIPNYFIFNHNNRWRKIIDNFDQLSSKKNKIYSMISWCIIILIIINMIASFYSLDQLAKKNHTGPYSKEYIDQQIIKDSISDAKFEESHN